MNDPLFFMELDAFSDTIDEEVEHFVMDIVRDTLTLITEGNPLDTGRCTASWTASLNMPLYQEATDVTEQHRLDRTQAQERSLQTMPNIQGYHIGDIIYLTNGTNYVSRLEEDVGYVKTTNGYGHFVSFAKAVYEGNGVRMEIRVP
jgi:hypothetical protein